MIWGVIPVVRAVWPDVRRQQRVVVSTGAQAQVLSWAFKMFLDVYCDDLWLEMSFKERPQPFRYFSFCSFFCSSHDREAMVSHPLSAGLEENCILQHFTVNYTKISRARAGMTCDWGAEPAAWHRGHPESAASCFWSFLSWRQPPGARSSPDAETCDVRGI